MVRINNKKYSRKIRNNTIRRNKTNRKAKSKANRKTNRKAKSKANRKTNRKTNRKAKGKANRKVMVGGMMAAAPPPAALVGLLVASLGAPLPPVVPLVAPQPLVEVVSTSL